MVSYFSRATRKDERKWDTQELEVLALIATLEHFHQFVEGQKLYLQTDHRNVTWLGSMKNFSGRLGRWVLRLAEYNAEVAYRKGAYLFVADCLSRNSIKGGEEPDDPIAGRMPKGLDGPEEAPSAPAAAKAEVDPDSAVDDELFGLSEDSTVGEVVVTEVSPFDTDTPTTFMCEYVSSRELTRRTFRTGKRRAVSVRAGTHHWKNGGIEKSSRQVYQI